MSGTCAACRFSKPNASFHEGWRECWRYPPRWVERVDHSALHVPHVRDQDVCGEWSAALCDHLVGYSGDGEVRCNQPAGHGGLHAYRLPGEFPL